MMFNRAKFLSLGLSLFALNASAKEDPFERGDAAIDAGNYPEAVGAYTEAIKDNPTKARGYISRSIAYDLLNESDKALQDATKAIELEPKNPEGYDARGWVKYTRKPNAE